MFRLIDRTVEGIAVFAFAVSSIFICINVINRYLVLGAMRELSRTYESFAPVYLFFREWLGAISVTADEVPGFLLVWVAFLGAYLALRREGHISFDLLLDALPTRARKVVIAINMALLGLFLSVLLGHSIRMIRVAGRTEIETAEIAQGWFMLIMPIASLLLICAMARRIQETFFNKPEAD